MKIDVEDHRTITATITATSTEWHEFIEKLAGSTPEDLGPIVDLLWDNIDMTVRPERYVIR